MNLVRPGDATDFLRHGIMESDEGIIPISLKLVRPGDIPDYIPEILVPLNKGNKLLRSVVRTFLTVAEDEHRPILDRFMEVGFTF